MILEINKIYVLNFNVDGHNLTYTGKIVECDSSFVVFTDKFGDKVTYNISALTSAKEIKND